MRVCAKKTRGFTLIELLVVIAIIAILAAILFPVFMKARETARMSRCVSNLKQISTALTLYVDNNNQTLPGHWNGAYMGPHHCKALEYAQELHDLNKAKVYPYMQDLLAPYCRSMTVWLCPSIGPNRSIPKVDYKTYPQQYNTYLTSMTWGEDTGNFAGRSSPTNYGWLWVHASRYGGASYNSGAKVARIRRATRATMFVEMPFWSVSQSPHTRGEDMGIHVSYYDGHAKFQRPPGFDTITGTQGSFNTWSQEGWDDSPK